MGPTLKAQQTSPPPLFCSPCLACIPLKAQQHGGAQTVYSKAGQISAGLIIAGESGAHARESMNHTRFDSHMFRRYFGANES